MKLIFILFLCTACAPFIKKDNSNSTPHNLNCYFNAGGVSKKIELKPTSIYNNETIRVNTYFRIKIALYTDIKDDKYYTLNIYTYAPYDDQDKPISISTNKISMSNKNDNLVGTHFIYEPDTEAELKYWCENI